MLAEPRKGRLEGWLHQAAGRVRGSVERKYVKCLIII